MKQSNLRVPDDVRELWAVTGGGDFFESETIFRPTAVPCSEPYFIDDFVFCFIGKEIERRAQEGEDFSVFEPGGPMRYEPGKTKNTRAADPGWILRAKRFHFRQLMREARVGQHTLERFLRGERVQSKKRLQIQKAVDRLERQP